MPCQWMRDSEMSVTRIGEMLHHPAWVRSASRVPFGEWWQFWFHRALFVSEKAANLMAALLTPAAVIALALGLWRLAADLDWTETFPISNGLFSHWLVWIAIAIGLSFGASSLAPKAA